MREDYKQNNQNTSHKKYNKLKNFTPLQEDAEFIQKKGLQKEPSYECHTCHIPLHVENSFKIYHTENNV